MIEKQYHQSNVILNLFQDLTVYGFSGPRIMKMNKYFVYIVTNKSNKVLYIGVTNNLERRMFEHKTK